MNPSVFCGVASLACWGGDGGAPLAAPGWAGAGAAGGFSDAAAWSAGASAGAPGWGGVLCSSRTMFFFSTRSFPKVVDSNSTESAVSFRILPVSRSPFFVSSSSARTGNPARTSSTRNPQPDTFFQDMTRS